MNSVARNFVWTFGKRGSENFAPIFKDTPSLSLSYVHDNKFIDRSKGMGSSKHKYMFVGLGNFDLPQTRHSVGMQVVDKMAEYLNVSFSGNRKCSGCVGIATIDNFEFVLLKPKMPMNVNGTSVARTAQFFDVPAKNIYLLHDDIDRGLGKLCLKEKGSANGHNGVRSVMNSLRTEEIPRVKIGIDRPPTKEQVGDYVLQNFPPKEQQIINQMIEKSLHRVAKHMAETKEEEVAKVFQELLENQEKKKAACGSL